MMRNPYYWEQGKSYLDEIGLLAIPEAAARAEALKNGDVDLVYALDPQSVPTLISDICRIAVNTFLYARC